MNWGRFAVTACLACGGLLYGGCIRPPGQVVQDFEATLDGDQEVPPAETDGSGEGTFTRRNDVLEFEVTASGLTGPVTIAHFHDGPEGVAGPIIFDLTDLVEEDANGNITITGEWDMDAADIEALEAGDVYVNIHTAMFPAGEVRGQLVLVP